MLQNKINILCTKAVDEAFINDAASKNIFTDVVPFIKTEPISSVELQQEIAQASTLLATVVFTSVNAVEAVITGLNGDQPHWRIYCMGHATFDAAMNYFEKELISGTANSATELAERMIYEKNVGEVIFFCGDQRRNELPELLKKNNIDVNEIIVYQTISVPHKIEKKYDGILFFSPSAVRSFFQNNRLDPRTVLFAIGHTTASEIKKNSENKIVVSDEPEKKFLLEKVISYFQTHSINN